MSERTFRAVVAAVLVGALVLAAIVVVVLARPAQPEPAPTPTGAPTAATTPSSTVAPTPTPEPTPTPIAFGEVGLTGVGDVRRGGASGPTLVLRLTEASPDAIPDGPGTLVVSIADAASGPGTVSFTGTPAVDAPDSLGATAQLDAPNTLRISIVASDRFNIEPITVTGLAIAVSADAALGPMTATFGPFAGSLVGGVASPDLPSPGTVIAAP